MKKRVPKVLLEHLRHEDVDCSVGFFFLSSLADNKLINGGEEWVDLFGSDPHSELY